MKTASFRLLKSKIWPSRQGMGRRLRPCCLVWLTVAVLAAGGCGEPLGSFDVAPSSDAWITEAELIQKEGGRKALAQLRATFTDYPVQDMYYQRLHMYRHRTTGDPTTQVVAYHATPKAGHSGELLYRFRYCIRVVDGLVTYSRKYNVYQHVEAVDAYEPVEGAK